MVRNGKGVRSGERWERRVAVVAGDGEWSRDAIVEQVKKVVGVSE